MKLHLKNRNVLIIIIIAFFSCTKYEKGPKFSFRNKENVLFQTRWELINIYKNDNLYYTQYTMRPGNDTLSIFDIDFPKGYCRTISGNRRIAHIYITGEFNKKTNELNITPTKYVVKSSEFGNIVFQTVTIPDGIELFLPEGTTTYKILRLTKEELILRSINLPNTYELHFLKFRKNER